MTDDQIIRLIEAFARETGRSVSTASRLASGHGDTIERMRAGMSLTIRRANNIISRVSDLWPSDRPWPSDILPRPAGREEAA